MESPLHFLVNLKVEEQNCAQKNTLDQPWVVGHSVSTFDLGSILFDGLESFNKGRLGQGLDNSGQFMNSREVGELVIVVLFSDVLNELLLFPLLVLHFLLDEVSEGMIVDGILGIEETLKVGSLLFGEGLQVLVLILGEAEHLVKSAGALFEAKLEIEKANLSLEHRNLVLVVLKGTVDGLVQLGRTLGCILERGSKLDDGLQVADGAHHVVVFLVFPVAPGAG